MSVWNYLKKNFIIKDDLFDKNFISKLSNYIITDFDTDEFISEYLMIKNKNKNTLENNYRIISHYNFDQIKYARSILEKISIENDNKLILNIGYKKIIENVREHLHNNKKIIYLDIENCFESINLSVLYYILGSSNPDVVEDIKKLYNIPSELSGFNNCVIKRFNGLRTGCPLSMTLLKLYLKYPLLICNHIEEIESVYVYVDDIILVVDKDSNTSDIINELQKNLYLFNLKINKKKIKESKNNIITLFNTNIE